MTRKGLIVFIAVVLGLAGLLGITAHRLAGRFSEAELKDLIRREVAAATGREVTELLPGIRTVT